MDKTKFLEGFDEMCSVFGIKALPSKAEFYFKRLMGATNDQWEKAVETVVLEDTKFPNVSRLSSAISHVQSEQHGKTPERQNCPICDGYGMVQIGLDVYAGQCVHGTKFASMRQAPIENEAVFSILRHQEDEYDSIYGKGTWKIQTGFLRRMAGLKCLPRGAWI